MEDEKMGRPTVKTPELIQEILDLITAGYRIEGICSRKGMPGRATVYRWRMNDAEFNNAYKVALSIRQEQTFEDVFAIADKEKKNNTEVAADRLRCSVRLKVAAMANPSLNRRRKSAQGKKKEPFRLPDELHVEIVRPGEKS